MSEAKNESSANGANLERLVRRLREESATHQTAFNDDRRRKLLLAEAADTIEHLLNEAR